MVNIVRQRPNESALDIQEEQGVSDWIFSKEKRVVHLQRKQLFPDRLFCGVTVFHRGPTDPPEAEGRPRSWRIAIKPPLHLPIHRFLTYIANNLTEASISEIAVRQSPFKGKGEPAEISASDVPENLIQRWNVAGNSREVSLIRTSQDHLICQVFNRRNILSRRMIKIPDSINIDLYTRHLCQNTRPIMSPHTDIAALVNNTQTYLQKWQYCERDKDYQLQNFDLFLFQDANKNQLIWIAMDNLHPRMKSWVELSPSPDCAQLASSTPIIQNFGSDDPQNPCRIEFNSGPETYRTQWLNQVQGIKHSVSIDEVPLPRQSTEELPQWLTGEKEITLFRAPNNLKYLVRDATTRAPLWQGFVNRNLTPDQMEERIAELRGCEVLVQGNQLYFLKPLRKWKVGCLVPNENEDFNQAEVFRNQELTVSSLDARLVWCLYDPLTKKNVAVWDTPRQYADHLVRPSPRCSSGARRSFAKYLEGSQLDRAAFIVDDIALWDLKVERPGVSPPFSVYLEPKTSMQSKIDENIRLSNLTWGATLVCYGEGNPFHSQLIFEGIARNDFEYVVPRRRGGIREIRVQKGQYFMLRAEFDGESNNSCRSERDNSSGVVIVKKMEPNTLTYNRRSRVHKISSIEAEKVLEEIIKESRGETPPKKLNMWGRNSIFADFSSEDSCLTWVLSKLGQLGVRHPDFFVDNLTFNIISTPLGCTANDSYYKDHFFEQFDQL